MTDHEKIESLMKDLGLNYFKIAEITGHTYQSVKTMLQPNKPIPRWFKLVIYAWEKKREQ